MLDENMGAAHRGLHCSWPPGRPRCPSVPGRPLDDLHGTPSGEASYLHADEGEVVRGGADHSRPEQINQMQQLSHTNQPTKRNTKDTGEKHKHTPKVSDRQCTPRKTQKSENIVLLEIVENVMAVIVRQKSALKSTSKHIFSSISHFSPTHIVSHNWYCQVHTDAPKRQKSSRHHAPYIHTHDTPQNDLPNTQIPNIPLHTQKRAFS